MIDLPITVNSNSVTFFDPSMLPFYMTITFFIAIVLFISSKIGKNIAEAIVAYKNAIADMDRAALDRERYEENLTETSDDSNSTPSFDTNKKKRLSEDGSLIGILHDLDN